MHTTSVFAVGGTHFVVKNEMEFAVTSYRGCAGYPLQELCNCWNGTVSVRPKINRGRLYVKSSLGYVFMGIEGILRRKSVKKLFSQLQQGA